MGISAGTSLALNISDISDTVSVTVNTISLFIYNYGLYAAALVGVGVLMYVTGVFKKILDTIRNLIG
jgi:hypothetical protein